MPKTPNLTNDGDESVVELCNPKTGDIMPIARRHDGGKRAADLVAQGWREATDEDREACIARAKKD